MALDAERIRKTVRKLRKLLKKMQNPPPPKQVHDFRTNSRRLEGMVGELCGLLFCDDNETGDFLHVLDKCPHRLVAGFVVRSAQDRRRMHGRCGEGRQRRINRLAALAIDGELPSEKSLGRGRA